MIDVAKLKEEVIGWLGDGEVERLHEIALGAPGNRAVEFGSFAGKSSCAIGSAIKERNGTLLCIDNWWEKFRYNFEGRVEDITNLYELFSRNIEKYGLRETIISIKGDIKNFLPILNGQFGLVFIDSDHTIDQCLPEALWAYKHIPAGGYIVFHDYGNDTWAPHVKVIIETLKNLWKGEWSHHWMLAIFKKA